MGKLKYPKGETIWVSYFNSKEELRFIITAKSQRDYYILYELVDNQFIKLGKGKFPPELEKRFNIKTLIQ